MTITPGMLQGDASEKVSGRRKSRKAVLAVEGRPGGVCRDSGTQEQASLSALVAACRKKKKKTRREGIIGARCIRAEEKGMRRED